MTRELSSREKSLAMIVGAAAFLFVNYFIIDYFRTNKAALDLDLAKQSAQLSAIRSRASEKPKWEQRNAWLTAKQPKVVNDDAEGVQLLGYIKKVAEKYNIAFDPPPRLNVPSRKPEYTAFTVDMDAKCPWKPLINFLTELQQPEQFIVVEKTNLKIDTADQTQMKAKITVGKWFAPR